MIEFPNSKINLGLNITSKRKDGYHNIETVFFPIQMHDALEIAISQEDTNFTFSGIEIDGKVEENVCFKAYQALKQDFKISNIKCHLHKATPIGAGLGGGSADAAYMLVMLNKIFGLNLSKEQLSEYAAAIGADCAFFIYNKPLLAKGIGNEFESINLNLKGKHLVLVKPPIHVGTKEAYSKIQPQKSKISIKEVLAKPINEWRTYLKNDFEESIFPVYPEIEEIKSFFYEKEALYASMSGSGSAVYGIFDQMINLQSEFPEKYYYWSEKMA